MFLIFICSLLYIFYIVNDLIPVYKAENRTVFWVYLSLFATSYTLHMLILQDVKLPGPSDPIRWAVTIIFGKYIQ